MNMLSFQAPMLFGVLEAQEMKWIENDSEWISI